MRREADMKHRSYTSLKCKAMAKAGSAPSSSSFTLPSSSKIYSHSPLPGYGPSPMTSTPTSTNENMFIIEGAEVTIEGVKKSAKAKAKARRSDQPLSIISSAVTRGRRWRLPVILSYSRRPRMHTDAIGHRPGTHRTTTSLPGLSCTSRTAKAGELRCGTCCR